jgi:phosphatidylinositol glycan class P protein
VGMGEEVVDWKGRWSTGTDAVLDVPIGGVCEILYGGEE